MPKGSLHKVRKTIDKNAHRHIQSGFRGTTTRHSLTDISRLVSAAGHDVRDILQGDPRRRSSPVARFGVNLFQLYRTVHSAPSHGTVTVDPHNSRHYDFSQHVLSPKGPRLEIRGFVYRGSRTNDFAHADAWAKISSAERLAKKWVWHHVQDVVFRISGTRYEFTGTLQLIDEAIHKAYNHNGGVHQSRQVLEAAARAGNRDAANQLNGWYV